MVGHQVCRVLLPCHIGFGLPERTFHTTPSCHLEDGFRAVRHLLDITAG